MERVTFHIRQLHPQLIATTTLWDYQSGGAMQLGREHGLQDTPFFQQSPVKAIYDGEPAQRWRLDDSKASLPFTILEDLKSQGYTDYTVRPLNMSTGRPAAQSLATRDPAGFSPLHLAIVDAVEPALSTVLELSETRRTAQTLLDTYIGRNAGARVMKGRIRRGEGEIIDAVIWLCDLRGFTRLTETLPVEEVIQHLNTYFDTIGGPIQNNGGEILKFVGDAILAVFTKQGDETDLAPACLRAAKAAREALDARTALNARRNIVGCPAFDCGIALHVGEVMYGNIGAADRLDFTVIGRAVNLASRLEALSATTGQPVIVSEAFASLTNMTCHPLGTYEVKGVDEPQSVYALAGCA